MIEFHSLTPLRSRLLLACLVTALPAAGRAQEGLTLTFTTSTAGGSYSPRNIHAVWVETEQGQFIQTLDLWANSRAGNLTQWVAATDDRAGDIDGRTGATQSNYGRYTSRWDLTNRSGELVPDGTYRIRLELTDDNANRNRFNRASWTFEKGPQPLNTSLPDQDGYRNVQLVYQPLTVTLPGVQSLPPTDITDTSAQALGRVTSSGGQIPTVRLYWGPQDGGTDPAQWEQVLDLGEQTGDFNALLAPLQFGQTYFYRAQASNSAGDSWAPESVSLVALQTLFRVFREGDTWRFFRGKTYPGATWTAIDFDDQAWESGPSGFGYDDGDDNTVLQDMEQISGVQAGYLTAYLRFPFEVPRPEAVVDLEFRVDFDDGFVAFLNGREVARANVPAGQTHTTEASPGHSASVDGGSVAVYSLNAYLDDLVPGENLFAIEVHNVTIDSSDLSLIPELDMELDRSGDLNPDRASRWATY